MPPPAVSLAQIDAMLAGWFGVKREKPDEQQMTQDQAVARLMEMMPKRAADKIMTAEEFLNGRSE